MRPVEKLVHSRTRVCPNYALMPLEGFPTSRLPGWVDAQVKVLASPALGAHFVQYVIDIPKGGWGNFSSDPQIETFYFVISGMGICMYANGQGQGAADELKPGSFGLIPPGFKCEFKAAKPTTLIILRKRYESASGVELFQPVLGNEAQVAKDAWADNPHSLLQTLIPDEIQYDMAMNIFTFDPGFGLPVVETHVMEHGLYFMQGKGMYFLGDQWMEVEAHDFIWMGPYCPQSFYATGPTPSRYLYYKNVNRDIAI